MSASHSQTISFRSCWVSPERKVVPKKCNPHWFLLSASFLQNIFHRPFFSYVSNLYWESGMEWSNIGQMRTHESALPHVLHKADNFQKSKIHQHYVTCCFCLYYWSWNVLVLPDITHVLLGNGRLALHDLFLCHIICVCHLLRRVYIH